MIDTWEARRLEKVFSSGRTRPLLIDCEKRSGGRSLRARFVVKAIGLPEVHDFTLCNEYLGSSLAHLAGVRVAKTAFVNISPAFVSATNSTLESHGLRIEPGLAIGSHYISSLLPMPRIPVIHDDQREDAVRLYAFDLATQNPDRRAANPNCGYAAGRMVAFDFENAFSFRFAIGSLPPAWQVSQLGFHQHHVFYKALRGTNVNWRPFMTAFRRIDATALEGLYGTMPNGWHPSAAPIGNHVLSVLERSEDFERELAQSLL